MSDTASESAHTPPLTPSAARFVFVASWLAVLALFLVVVANISSALP
jgi:hypothetical protein